MEIEIQCDPNDSRIFTTTIADTISGKTISVQTTVATYRNRQIHRKNVDDSAVSEWVRQVKKIYSKKKRQTLAVGISVERSDNYANGTNNDWYYRTFKPKQVPPYEILQICVGNHALIYQPNLYGFPREVFPKVLRDFLSDNNTIVFGVGIHSVAKKLEEDFGLKISRPWDLRRLAECYNRFWNYFPEITEPYELLKYNRASKPTGEYAKFRVEKLAKEILGRAWDVMKPDKIRWYDSPADENLSDEKVMYGTVDAFLAYEMGMTFLDACPGL